jgi:hypothetical protein
MVPQNYFVFKLLLISKLVDLMCRGQVWRNSTTCCYMRQLTEPWTAAIS